MTEQLLTAGWTVTDPDTGARTDVTLPHDAMIHRTRTADAPSGYHGAYFPGGRYRYECRLPALEAANQRVRFEGIGGAAVIELNGTELARVTSRYRETVVDLTPALRPGSENILTVEVDDSAQPNSRWYTGSGLYRPVWLDTAGPARFAHDGIRIVTSKVTNGTATLRVDVTTDHAGVDPSVEVVVRGEAGVVGSVTGSTGSLTLDIPSARLWTADNPHLYDIEIALTIAGESSDVRTVRYGIRTLEVDSTSGLRINGEQVLLRGACIHHDSGVLGAATYRAFEFRRARILKANGYNAVRSSHNPLSRDMLDACDEIGLYVMDELTDVWFSPKTEHDRAEHFEDTWPDDLRSMVAKDRNHASVIMYSIGNEIGDTATEAGVDAARRMTTLAHELDDTRQTTLAVNFLLNVLASRGKSVFDMQNKSASADDKKPTAVTSTFANVIADKIGALTGFLARLPIADRTTRDAFAAVDIAGYNYGVSRYRTDARRYPDRIVVGSETMPGDIARIWPLVKELPNLIGDFMWTGWDYLGEAGLGDWAYGPEFVPLTKPYPQITAGTGAIDILGNPGVGTLLARAAWGLLDQPAIAVRPLDKAGMKVRRSAWRSSDAVSSWAWRGTDGARAEIEVYSDADEVELLLNGRSLGRRRTGRRHGYVARFSTAYAPGELVAIAYRRGAQAGRSVLRSASAVRLELTAEEPEVTTTPGDIGFVAVELKDEDGVIEMLDDDDVTLTLEGPAVLVGFGSAASATTESFVTASHRTYRGRALAVIRVTGAGEVTLHATSRRHGEATATLTAVLPGETLSRTAANA